MNFLGSVDESYAVADDLVIDYVYAKGGDKLMITSADPMDEV